MARNPAKAPHSNTKCLSSPKTPEPHSVHSLQALATMANSSRQLVTTKPKLQKALHVLARHRQLTKAPTSAKRLKPLSVCATNNTCTRELTWAIQSNSCKAKSSITQNINNCRYRCFSMKGNLRLRAARMGCSRPEGSEIAADLGDTWTTVWGSLLCGPLRPSPVRHRSTG